MINLWLNEDQTKIRRKSGKSCRWLIAIRLYERVNARAEKRNWWIFRLDPIIFQEVAELRKKMRWLTYSALPERCWTFLPLNECLLYEWTFRTNNISFSLGAIRKFCFQTLIVAWMCNKKSQGIASSSYK